MAKNSSIWNNTMTQSTHSTSQHEKQSTTANVIWQYAHPPKTCKNHYTTDYQTDKTGCSLHSANTCKRNSTWISVTNEIIYHIRYRSATLGIPLPWNSIRTLTYSKVEELLLQQEMCWNVTASDYRRITFKHTCPVHHWWSEENDW